MNSCEKWDAPTRAWEVPSTLAPGVVALLGMLRLAEDTILRTAEDE